MIYEIQTTAEFNQWVAKLKDRQAAMAIAQRLDRVINGNLGDTKSLGDGVSEMRIFVGQGYRLYFTLRGGDKSSQQRDIQKA